MSGGAGSVRPSGPCASSAAVLAWSGHTHAVRGGGAAGRESDRACASWRAAAGLDTGGGVFHFSSAGGGGLQAAAGRGGDPMATDPQQQQQGLGGLAYQRNGSSTHLGEHVASATHACGKAAAEISTQRATAAPAVTRRTPCSRAFAAAAGNTRSNVSNVGSQDQNERSSHSRRLSADALSAGTQPPAQQQTQAQQQQRQGMPPQPPSHGGGGSRGGAAGGYAQQQQLQRINSDGYHGAGAGYMAAAAAAAAQAAGGYPDMVRARATR